LTKHTATGACHCAYIERRLSDAFHGRISAFRQRRRRTLRSRRSGGAEFIRSFGELFDDKLADHRVRHVVGK
jgi:hypothetical protein